VQNPRQGLREEGLADARRTDQKDVGLVDLDVVENATVTDLRLGFYPNFVFSFLIGRENGAGMEAVNPIRLPAKEPRAQALAGVWKELKGIAAACVAPADKL